MEKTYTQRGFGRINFKDRGGDECSLQMSSLAETSAIWLGANDSKISVGSSEFNPYWKVFNESDIKSMVGGQCVIGNSRMHLTQDMVKELLPYLQRFAETGEIFDNEE